RLVDPAANGTVKLRKAKVRTNKVPRCPSAELPAWVVFYRAKPGYCGTDNFTLEVTGESGVPSRHKFNVNVDGCQNSTTWRSRRQGTRAAFAQKRLIGRPSTPRC